MRKSSELFVIIGFASTVVMLCVVAWYNWWNLPAEPGTTDLASRTERVRQASELDREATAALGKQRGEAHAMRRTSGVLTGISTGGSLALLSVLILHEHRRTQGTRKLGDQRKNETEPDRFFDLSLDLLCIAGPDGYFKRLNPAFERTLGYTTDELMSRPFLDFVHPEDRPATVREMETLIGGAPTIRFENRYQCKDGTWKRLSWKCQPYLEGQVIYSIARDVTEVSAVVESLQASEENLAVTLQSIGDGVLATDAERRITRLNAAAERLTGWALNEGRGRAVQEIFQIINENTRNAELLSIGNTLATGATHALGNHTLLIARDGTERWIAGICAPIRDRHGQVIGAVVVFRDVTTETRLSRALRASEAYNRTIVMSSPDCLQLLTLDARLRSMGPTGQRMMEVDDFSDLENACWLAFWKGDHRVEAERAVGAARVGGTGHFQGFSPTVKGTPKWWDVVITPIPDAHGNPEELLVVSRDITDRRKMECELRASESFMRSVLNSMRANIAVLDSEGTILAVNDSWERFAMENGAESNLPRVSVNINYLSVCERATRDLGEEAHRILSGLKDILSGSRDSFSHEYPCHSPNEQRWFVMHACPLTRPEGGAVITHIDTTDRKRAEQVLSDFKAALDEHAIVSITDARGRIIYVNDKFCLISRYGREELVNYHHQLINSGHHSKPFFQELWGTISSGRVWKGEIKNRAKGGSFYWVNTTIVPFLGADGKPCQYIAIQTDITERKTAEAELERSRAQLESLFESLPGLYLVLTPELEIIAVSNAYLKATMTERENLLGRDLFEIFPDNPDNPAATGTSNLRASLDRVRQTGEPDAMAIQRYDIRRPDGVFEERYWSPINAPVLGANRKVDYIVHRVEDVTDFVRQKSRAPGGSTPLHARVEQMEAEIFRNSQQMQIANRQLLALNAELESFSYTVSHDLRAPLRHISAFGELLMRRAVDKLDAKSLSFLKNICEAATEMSQLIDKLLAFSRMGRVELLQQTVALNALVHDIIESMELELELEGRRVQWTIAPLPSVHGDPSLLRQVFVNLLSNAIKYSRPRNPAIIEIGCREESPSEWTFFVRDNGVGFDMQFANKLFGVFQRLHASHQFEGTGVGLAMVRRVIGRHGGRTWAEGIVDGGATVFFSLPKVGRPPQP